MFSRLSMYTDTFPSDLFDKLYLITHRISRAPYHGHFSKCFHDFDTINNKENITFHKKYLFKKIKWVLSTIYFGFGTSHDHYLDFAIKCNKQPRNRRLFPLRNANKCREEEKFTVKFASGTKYRNSVIPFCQRLL